MPTVDELVRNHAPQMTHALKAAAQGSPTEAAFRRPVEQILADFAEQASVPLRTHHEYSVATGRADTVYNRLIIEYKRPGHLTGGPSRNNTAAVEQTQRYIQDIEREQRIQKARLIGVVTDGRWMIYCRHLDGRWRVESPVPVNVDSVTRLLTLLVRLQAGAAMVATNLIEDFGSDTLTAQRATRALYAALQGSQDPLVQALFEQWQIYFGEVTGHGEGAERLRSKAEFKKFAKGMGLTAARVDPPHLFFSVHTYFALLIKLIAWLTVSHALGSTDDRFRRLQDLSSDKLRDELRAMERGQTFRDYGLRNLLEGDFFAWYLNTWDDQVERQVRDILKTLSRYDPSTLQEEPDLTRDLLKQLYQYLVPRHLRHDLGEYYTPDWLAQRVLNMVDGGTYRGNPRKRLLDPACGSGTFIVLAIKATRDYCRQHNIEHADALELILSNIVGIDLNPLAVIAARTNYLLALGDLVKARGERAIEIPIYLADSILTPGLGSDLFSADQYQVRLAILGEPFLIPRACATQERISILAEVLDRSIEDNLSTAEFLSQVRAAVGLTTAEYYAADVPLTVLYERLADLHRRGLDGLWARIIKNAFAPVFLERFDYVVGNPPWVNWESLPEAYRDDTAGLWKYYGMAATRGKASEQFELGKQKRDISTLMTYIALDKYVRDGGRLGFLITQSVFKTGGAEGFRRFRLPDGTSLGVIAVDDMSKLKPFEGASNRTAVVVLERKRATTYPLRSYSFWYKERGGSNIPEDMTLTDIRESKIASYYEFFAEPVDDTDLASPWLTGRERALNAVKKVMGTSSYRAAAGICTWLNGVYWLEPVAKRPGNMIAVVNITKGAKRTVQQVQKDIESDLVYPLLRGRNIERWRAISSASILIPHTPKTSWQAIPEETLRLQYPETSSYLSLFRESLLSRSGYRLLRQGHPFYILGNINTASFAPYKVVWRGEVAPDLIAAVIGEQSEKCTMPDQTAYFIGFETPSEAHYVCALLNSLPIRGYYRMRGYKHVSISFVEALEIRRFQPTNPAHLRLAALSEQAHIFSAANDAAWVREIEAEIDRLVAQLWSLTDEDLADIQRSLRELK